MELVGKRRVHILNTSDLDGYRVAEAEVMSPDQRPDAGSPEVCHD